jgi:hypothetical protein
MYDAISGTVKCAPIVHVTIHLAHNPAIALVFAAVNANEQAAGCCAFFHWNDFGIGRRGQLQRVLSKLNAVKVEHVLLQPAGHVFDRNLFHEKKKRKRYTPFNVMADDLSKTSRTKWRVNSNPSASSLGNLEAMSSISVRWRVLLRAVMVS